MAVKRDIEDPLQRAMALAGIDVPLTTLPFPVRQWRPVFERDLAELLRDDFRPPIGDVLQRAGERSDGTATDAVVDAVREARDRP